MAGRPLAGRRVRGGGWLTHFGHFHTFSLGGVRGVNPPNYRLTYRFAKNIRGRVKPACKANQ